MDIRKLVNQGQARQVAHHPSQMNGRDWPAHQTLPPLSSMFPDPAYATGFQYPMAPQGEGFSPYATQYYQQQPQMYLSQQQPMPQQQQQQQFRPEMPYLSNNPAARNSSSTVSVSSTKYAASTGSGPATSAERRSLSDEEEDDVDSDEDVSGGSSPQLPPYYATSQTPAPQQVCFLDTSVQSPATDGVDYVCDDCGVSYSRAPDLRRHKASVHNDRDSREKVAATFPCEVCGQVLLSSHGYQGHMRRHYDERPFVCEAPFCGKAFHDSATLARHRRTHSTEHKFECDFCGRRFKRKDNLNTHRKKHQVGGESINPNLLRKPVTRVSGATDSPPGGTPQYTELPLAAPVYQPTPPYTQEQPVYAQPLYQAPPYYQAAATFQPYPQQQRGQFVKAEDSSDMMDYRSRQPRMTHLPPSAR